MMEDRIENIESVVKHWYDSSEKDYITMQNLLKMKDFNWALFLGHLVLEKLLKAVYVKNMKQHAIFTHDLLRLARKTGLNFPNEYEEWLDEITTFNLNARYDNYKQSFYMLCTEEFTENWIGKIEDVRKWLINQL
jgi:HEPN domain-containing protein